MARALYTAAEARKAGLPADQAAALAWSIERCVSRLHVSTSFRNVVRDACDRLRLAAKRRRKAVILTRAQRHFVYRCALKAHECNRSLYRRVMSGAL